MNKSIKEIPSKDKCNYCSNDWVDIIEDELGQDRKVCEDCFEWMLDRLTQGTLAYKVRMELENDPVGQEFKRFMKRSYELLGGKQESEVINSALSQTHYEYN